MTKSHHWCNSWSQCLILIPIKNIDKINYYMQQVSSRNLSKRQLQEIIKSNEYVIKYCSDNRIIARKYEVV